MRSRLLPLALGLALGLFSADPAPAQTKTPDQAQAPAQTKDQTQTKDQAKDQAQAQDPLLLLKRDHSAEEAKDSLQGQSHGRGDGGHGGPSAGFGGMGPSHGGGAGPHR